LRSSLVRLGGPAVVGTGIAAILARRRAGHSTPVAPAPASAPAPKPASAPAQASAGTTPERAPSEPRRDDANEPAAASKNGDQTHAAEPRAAVEEPDSDPASNPVAGVAQAARRGLRKATEAVRTAPAGDEKKAVANEWSCECGQSFRVSGQGRHRVFWKSDAEASDPVVGTTCPECDRPLPRSR